MCVFVSEPGLFSHDVNMDDKKSYYGNGKDHSIQ